MGHFLNYRIGLDCARALDDAGTHAALTGIPLRRTVVLNVGDRSWVGTLADQT